MGSPETGRVSDFSQNRSRGLSKISETLQSSPSSSKVRLGRKQKIPALSNQASYFYNVLRFRCNSRADISGFSSRFPLLLLETVVLSFLPLFFGTLQLYFLPCFFATWLVTAATPFSLMTLPVLMRPLWMKVVKNCWTRRLKSFRCCRSRSNRRAVSGFLLSNTHLPSFPRRHRHLHLPRLQL